MASKPIYNMGEAAWWLVLGSLLMMLEPGLGWGNSCPAECSCHLGYLADLPLNLWQESNTEKKVNEHHQNEVFYEDDLNKTPGISGAPTELLKMAMCIFQTSVSPVTLLDQLPVDIQVLSLLQGRNTHEILLEAESLQGFHNLIYLDIQGYSHEANQEIRDTHETSNNSLILSHNIFKSLISLKFLNLQNIKLQSLGENDNKIHSVNTRMTDVDPLSNEITINLLESTSKRKGRRHPSELKLQNLIFLSQPTPENEIVPYKTYLERKAQAGPSTFAGLLNLEFLRIYSCDLHDISWEMFEGLHKLSFLSLEQNHLLFIPEFAFYGTPNLKTLSLSHNKLLNLHSTSLAGLLKLENLDLSYNKFSHLSEFSLPPFPKLRTANFKHNPIEAIFASTFEIMNATKILYLGGNSSTLDIHPNSFLGLHSLQKLSIDNVSIDSLERQLLCGMPELSELEIFGNIKSLSFDAFVEVPKLEKLFLKDCKIELISMDAFYGLYSLLILDLSHNLLQTLPPGLFDQQFSLKELFLQNNLLKELPVGFFKNLPAKIIRLEGNPWHCSCSMKDWPSSVINKVKQRKASPCQSEYDKGILCSPSYDEIYSYDKRVTPHCSTPSKYEGWGVFQVLRKELRCNKKLKNKLNRTYYLKKKYEDYKKLVKTGYYERKEYIGQMKQLSKSRNNIFTSGPQTNHSDTQIKEPHFKGPELSIVDPLWTKPKSSEESELSNDHISTPMADANQSVNGEKSILLDNTIDFKLRNKQTNELNQVVGKNDLAGYDTDMFQAGNMPSNIKSKAVNNQPPLHNQKLTVLSKSKEISQKEKVSSNFALDVEEAKALKKAMKQEMERIRLKKLQKYYGEGSLSNELKKI